MSALAGAGPLLRVTLRQDARAIAPWVVGLTALSASSILAYDVTFDDPASRAQLAVTLGANPALSLVFGTARDLTTAEGFNAWRAGALGQLLAALMAIAAVVRNSRAQEDSGQAELLASGVMSRSARLQAALAVGWLASVVLGLVSCAATVAVGGGVADSAMLAATYTGAGLVFAGVAAVTAQLASDARVAASMATGALGVAFLARGYVDASGTAAWLTWLTPLGWLQETRPAAGNNPWPLLPALALAAVLAAAAFAIQGRRDYGQGLLAQRPGPARGGVVTSVWGLALRLNRGVLATWTAGLAVVGTVFGFVVTAVGDTGGGLPLEVLAAPGTGSSLASALAVTFLSLAGIIASILGVQVALRLSGEEVDHRVEPLLSGSLARPTFFASHAVVALASPALAVLVAGAAMGLVVSTADIGVTFGDVMTQAAVTVPAVQVVVALALAAIGALPRLRLLAWLGVVGSFGLTLFGPTFSLPGWALGVSPFHHVPNVVGASPDSVGLLVVGLLAVALTGVGVGGFRGRDVG